MADVELPDLPAAVVVNASDLLHIRQGAEDKKATVQLFSDSLDLVYLRQDDNLASIDNFVTARANLDVQSTSEASATFLEEVNNLSDLTNTSAARNNLGLGTMAVLNKGTGVDDFRDNSEQDDRYLLESNNLSDLTDAAAARTNLGVSSSSETLLVANNLSDVQSSATSRTNLGLGTLATQNEGTGVGDFRDNTANDARFLLESNNLSDLTSASTARTNLALGTMATQTEGTSGSQFRDNTANEGIFADVQSVTLSSSGNFTGGSIQVERVGKVVTISGDLTHALSSSPASLGGYIPTWASPTQDVSNVYFSSLIGTSLVNISLTGLFQTEYRDWAGAFRSQTSTSSITISYTVA